MMTYGKNQRYRAWGIKKRIYRHENYENAKSGKC
jgi:hypothetical protein